MVLSCGCIVWFYCVVLFSGCAELPAGEAEYLLCRELLPGATEHEELQSSQDGASSGTREPGRGML